LLHWIIAQCLHPGVFSLLDQALVSGTSFFTAVLIARACSHEDLGVYYLALTIVMLCLAVTCNLVSVPYTMRCNRRRGDARASHAGSTLFHQLAITLIAVVCLLMYASLLSLGVGPQSLRPVSWVLAGVMPLLLFREFVRRFAFAHLALRTAIAVDLAVTVLQLPGLLLAFYFHRLSVPTVYAIMGGACAVACAAWFVTMRQPMRLSGARIIPDWRDHWSFGKWALAGQVAGLASCLLPWMLNAVHGATATGVLGAGNTLIGLANLFVMGMANFLTPRTAHAYAEGGAPALSSVLHRAALLFVVVLGAFCVATWFVGDVLAMLVFGSRYAGHGTLITVLALATLADALGITAVSGLWVLDRAAANLAIDVVQLLVTLAVAAGLVLPLGALGIALALLAGRLAGSALRWRLLRESLRNRAAPAVAEEACIRGGVWEIHA
jgi:O-antigen/teichoic acid export membrane protein